MKVWINFSLMVLGVFGIMFLKANMAFANYGPYSQCSTQWICNDGPGGQPNRCLGNWGCCWETRCCEACGTEAPNLQWCNISSEGGQGIWDFPFTCSGCTPSCTGYQCGQSNGCGGNCGTSDVNNWQYYWPDGGCDSAAPGGTCGNYQLTQTWWRADNCGNSQQFEQVASCGQSCVECGPSYGAWNACTAPTFTQSRTVSYSCQGPQNQTQACASNLSGVLFDASAVNDCSTIGSQPKISGATVRATSTQNQIGQSFTGNTNATGTYAISNLNVPDTYTLSFENLGGFDPNPKLSCDGGTTLALSASSSLTRRYGFSISYDPWFQTIGGDVYANSGITSNIPTTCSSSANCNNYTVGATTYTPLLAAGTGGTSGIATLASGSLNMGYPTYANARISQAGTWANSGYTGRNYDYGYFFARTASSDRVAYSGTQKPTGSIAGVYLSSGTLTLDGTWVVDSGNAFVMLHNGDVNVTGNIDVNPQGFLAVIASGTITFASNVTQVEGVYIGNALTVASTGNTGTEQRFTGEGTFVGWQAVNLLRDRGGNNNTQSTELFRFRPEFVINAPEALKISKVIWQEVAP